MSGLRPDGTRREPDHGNCCHCCPCQYEIVQDGWYWFVLAITGLPFLTMLGWVLYGTVKRLIIGDFS